MSRVLLVSHELSVTGAPNSLLRQARYMRGAGHEVDVWTYREGPLRARYEEAGFAPRVVSDSRAGIKAAADSSGPYDFILCKIGTVSDYYNLIHRHNLNHYFLCRAVRFGETHLMQDEIECFHLSTLRLGYEDAVKEYALRACTPLGRLLANRELPILMKAREIIKQDER